MSPTSCSRTPSPIGAHFVGGLSLSSCSLLAFMFIFIRHAVNAKRVEQKSTVNLQSSAPTARRRFERWVSELFGKITTSNGPRRT
ncbi:unnamed protein product, partial [Nesidiocoris tenuis]